MTEAAVRVLAHLTDLHVPAAGDLHGAVDAVARLRAALDAVARFDRPPDVVVISGDLADAADVEAYRRLRPVLQRALDHLGAPVLVVPGNHDDRDAMQAELPWPCTDRVVRAGGLRVIGLDTSVAGAHHGDLHDEQLAWLRRELAEPAAEGSILVVHHPPLATSTPLSGRLGLRHPDRLGAAIEGSDVRLVLGGHTHRVSGGTLAGVPVWVTPSTAVYADVSATDAFRSFAGGGLSRVDVFPHGVVTTYLPLDHDPTPLQELGAEDVERALADA